MAEGSRISPAACPQCGGLKPGHRVYCGAECQWASMRTRPLRTCKGCGQPFSRPSRGKDAYLYCGRVCAEKNRRKWASKAEAKRHHKALERKRKRLRLGLDEPIPCRICGVLFVRTTARQTKCSMACRSPVAERPCAWCARPFTPKHSGKKLCSLECKRAAIRARPKSRRPKGGRKDRHRARKAGVPYEWINRDKLFARDGWRCQVCGVNTPKSLRGKLVDRSPELDHRVPLAMGGSHTWDNVQTACRKCNAAKGAHRVVGQMNLFARPIAA